MIAKTKKSYNDHLFKNHQCKLLRVVEQKPRRPNSIVVVYYKLVVVQSGARVGDYRVESSRSCPKTIICRSEDLALSDCYTVEEHRFVR